MIPAYTWPRSRFGVHLFTSIHSFVLQPRLCVDALDGLGKGVVGRTKSHISRPAIAWMAMNIDQAYSTNG